jgi:hypothetical protein
VRIALALLLLAAPAPARERPRVVGNWVMAWGGSSVWAVRFDPSGRYYCQQADRQWQGRWHLLGDVLVVTERCTWPPPETYHDGEYYPAPFGVHPEVTYTVRLLPGRLVGVEGGIPFALRKGW